MFGRRFRDHEAPLDAQGGALDSTVATADANVCAPRNDPGPSTTSTEALDAEARAEHLRGIVRAHFTSVWRFLRRLGFRKDIVDDAAQELFFVAVRRLDDVQPGKERAFLMGAAVRIAVRLKRRAAREKPTEHVDMRAAWASERPETPETLLDDERARDVLYRLLSELDDRYRAIFVMFELEGLTMQEIADILEIPIGTVASRLRAAREDFRARLERHRARTQNKSVP